VSRLALAALLVLAAPAPALAAVPAAQTQAAELDRLVAALLPDAGMLDLAVRSFDRAVEQGPIADAELRALYKQHPGLKAGIADPVRAELTKLLKRELPALRAEVRAILASELSAREITDATAFFTSPTGAKVYAVALRSIGDKPDRNEAEHRDAATQAVMKSLAPEDYPAMLAFGASSAAGKMNRINPRVSAASRAWGDRVIKDSGPRMTKVARRAAKKFVKAQRRKAR
jgi:hypothetical protein